MNVLFLSAYSNPEITADTHIDNDLIDALISAGDTVTILCPTPTRGIDAETVKKYKHIKRESLKNGKLNVIRFWAPQEKRNPILRALRYFWCTIRQYQIGKRQIQSDAVYAISTPPTQGMLMALVTKHLSKKKQKNVKSVYYLEDIFPDTLVSAGMTREGSLLWKIGRKIENYTYKNVSKIVVLSEDCYTNVIKKGVHPDKVSIIYSWVDMKAVRYIPREKNRVLDEYHLNKSDFYVVYAGNFGEAQNIDVILDASKKLSHMQGIKFLLFGSGGNESIIAERIESEHLTNVRMFPLQKMEWISDVYSLGDVGIVSCKKGFGLSALPSKTWSIMACKRPVLASFDKGSQLEKILYENKCGILADADDADKLADAVKTIYELSEKDREEMGRNAYNFVKRTRDKEICLDRFILVWAENPYIFS